MCVRVQRKARRCDHERDAGLEGGLRSVSGAFAATSTGQLAAGLEKEDWMSSRGVQGY